jgi:hypothetical protein
VDVRPVEASFIYATGVMIVVNLDDQAASLTTHANSVLQPAFNFGARPPRADLLYESSILLYASRATGPAFSTDQTAAPFFDTAHTGGTLAL